MATRKIVGLLVGVVALGGVVAWGVGRSAIPRLEVDVTPAAMLGRGWVNGLAWSPDNTHLAVASSVGIWLYGPDDLSAPPRLLAGHTQPVSSVAFSPDGKILASGGWDKTVRVWDVATGVQQAVLEGHSGPVEAVAFSPDGRAIASGSDDTTLRLWDVNTKSEPQVFQGHQNIVTHVAFSPDGRYLASGSRNDNNLTIVWNTETKQPQTVPDLQDFEVEGLAFNQESTLLAIASASGTLRLWDLKTGEPKHELQGHHDVAFMPAGDLVASGGLNGGLVLWDSRTGQQQALLPVQGGHVNHLVFSPDGKRLAGVSNTGTLEIWDVATGAETALLNGMHGGGVYAIGFSAGGSVLVSGGGDALSGPSGIDLWDVKQATLQAALPETNGAVQSLAVSPNGGEIVVGTDQGMLEFRDGATGQLTKSIQGHQGRVLSVVFSPDGSVVASGGNDAAAYLWDAVTAEQRAALTNLGAPIRHLNLGADGNLLPSSGVKDITKLADLGHFEVACTAGGADGVTSMIFSPNRQYVASAYWNNQVNLAALDSGAIHATLEGHTANIWSLAFSPDSQIIATGSMDRTIRLWSVATGEQLAVLEGHQWDVNSLAFSPDGSVLASGSGDGTVRLWHIDVEPVHA